MRKRLIFWSILGAAIVAPIFLMMNCQGFHEGSMQVASCYVNLAPLRYLADLYYALILFSSFMMLLPLVAYLIGAWCIAAIVANVFDKPED